MTAPRPVFSVVMTLAGLVVWAAHFTAVYALSSVACERELTGRLLLGLPWVPALVGIATVLALALLALLLRSALRAPRMPLTEGGEAEPGFTRWFAASVAMLAVLAVLFQATPALVLPGCG